MKEEVAKSTFKNPPTNLKDWVILQVGETLYELFYKNYTIKQWNRNPEEIDANVAKRLPIHDQEDGYFNDPYQGLPYNGYTVLIEKMLDHPNIDIQFNTDYFNIKNSIEANLTIFTGELDRFFNYKYEELEYRSVDLVFETKVKEYFQPVAVVNYPNDYNYTRITEFKHFLNEKSKKTTLCYEYPKKKGEPYYLENFKN
ncbi:MAG: UDP-galactopyranose mutase [Candidatus Margulisiibacteriota bacterium]